MRLEKHPEEHRDGAWYANLTLEPEADGRTADADRIGEVVLGPIAERAHMCLQLVRGHGGEARVLGHVGWPNLDSVRTPVTGANPPGRRVLQAMGATQRGARRVVDLERR